ncbi:MAG: O-antigen ligase family protein [Vicinamibacterales bacterium]
MAAGDAVTSPQAAWRGDLGADAAPDWIFYGYLLLVGLEWTGLPNDIGVLRAARVTTLLAYTLFAATLLKGGGRLFGERQIVLLGGFVVWTVVSLAWAYITQYAFNAIRPLFDYMVFAVLTAYVIDRRARVDKLALLLGFVAMYLVARNFEKLGSTRQGGFEAPYFLGDGNDFAWGLNIILPLGLWLMIGRDRNVVIRVFGAISIAACLIGNIGTASRGGTIGLAALLLYGWWFVARRRALGVAAVAVVIVGVIAVAPSSYFSRMSTISDYEEDNSAQARLQAWEAASRMAFVFPLGTGAGNFNTAYGRWFNPSRTGQGVSRVEWGSGRWISPHSIYFRVIGEYGFGGFALLLWLIASNITTNNRSRMLLRSAPDGAPYDDRFPAVLNMSVIAFAVSGIFLGGFAYPHQFLLSGLVIGLKRTIESQMIVASAPAVAPTAPSATRLRLGFGPPALRTPASLPSARRG